MAKGVFVPKYPEKYVGNVHKITWRSSWELRFMSFCDMNQNIWKWGSEEIKIPYLKPTDNKIHNYIPDFWIMYKNSAGEVIKEIVEIKPKKEAVMTKKSSMYDKLSIVVNHAKWNAAKAFCEKAGLRFRILTEDDLFGKGKKK
jgi:hypothetical protein